MNPMPQHRLEFTVVCDATALRALGPAWQALWSRLANPHVFQTFEWCCNAWRHVASKRGNQLRIVVGRSGERVVLIWPMMVGQGVLRMLSSATLEYRDILVEPSEQATHWIAQAWQVAKRAIKADTYLFQNLRLPNHLSSSIAALGPSAGVGGGWCPVIRLHQFANWDAYAATLPKSLISDQRRQWKRLATVMPGLSFQMIDKPEKIQAVMDWISHHKRQWGDLQGKPAIWFITPDITQFLQAATAQALSEGRLVMATLANGDDILSAGWGFQWGSEFLFHMFAYDVRHASFSPSRLFLQRLIQHGFETGVHTFDFMPGEEAYKRIWATDYIRTVSYLGATNWGGAMWLQLARTAPLATRPVAELRRWYAVLPERLRARLRHRLDFMRSMQAAIRLPTPSAPPSDPTAASHESPR